MSFRGRDVTDNGSMNKMDLGGDSRRFGGGNMDDKSIGDNADDRRYDSGRGRRPPPFGRGRRPSPPGRGGDRSRDYGYGRDEPPSMRDRSPMRSQDDRFSDRFKKDDMPFSKRDDMGPKDMGRSFYGDEPHRDRFMDSGRSRLEGPGSYNSRFDGPSDPYKSRSMNYPGAAPPPKGFQSEGFPKPNECEIIAVSKHQRAYAENVEARIKQMGILVDVLFLKDEALLTQTVDDIARRGSLYAMVISQQNETHGSVTVNILHGTPQEHRNMPLEDALKLLSRNFHEHIRMQKEKMERERAERGAYIGSVSADREIQLLLRMLADGRWVSVAEISEVIRYLCERRDKMKSSPGEDRMVGRASLPPAASDSKLDLPFKAKEEIDVAKKEQDLQDRIMNLMNQGAPPLGNAQGPGLNVGGMPKREVSPARPSQPRISPNMNNMRPPLLGGNIPGLNSAPDENFDNQQDISARVDSLNKPAYPSGTTGSNPTSSSSATFINFDNESVQKALDNLIQSGPSLLKNISMTSANLSNPPPGGNVSKPASDTLSNDPIGMQRGGMGLPRGPGGMSDIMGSGPLRGPGNQDVGSSRGNQDMGPPRGNQDMGPPRGNQDVGPPRGTQDLGPPRGNLDMGPPRGNQDMGPPRGSGMSDMMGQRGPRSGSDMMGMGPQRGGFGGGSDIGGMGSMRGFSSGGMSDSGMGGPRMSDSGIGGPRMSDSGRMGGGVGGPRSMGPGNFPGSSQFGKYQGGNQPGNYPGSYNSSNMGGNMPRPSYGGGQGMGGGPRRY